MNQNIQLHHGDCLELLKIIPDGSVDLVLTDMPYGTVKGAKFYDYANGCGWDEILDMTKVWKEINRVTRPMANILLFSQEPFSNHLINSAIRNIPFAYRCIWKKDAFANPLIAKKACVNYYEDILLFLRNKDDYSSIHPLREYASKIFSFIGKSIEDINRDFGNYRADHFFRFRTSQFELCTERTYNDLIRIYNIDQMDGFISFEEVKITHQSFYKGRIFNLPIGAKSKSNVFEYKKDYNGYHPTQKPVALLEDLLLTYSNKGDLVLDFTMGSGSTGVACVNTNRRFIGIEKDIKYFEIAENRLKNN